MGEKRTTIVKSFSVKAVCRGLPLTRTEESYFLLNRRAVRETAQRLQALLTSP